MKRSDWRSAQLGGRLRQCRSRRRIPEAPLAAATRGRDCCCFTRSAHTHAHPDYVGGDFNFERSARAEMFLLVRTGRNMSREVSAPPTLSSPTLPTQRVPKASSPARFHDAARADADPAERAEEQKVRLPLFQAGCR